MGRSYTYQKARKLLHARTKQTGAPCAVCGGEFLWDVSHLHSNSFTAGHIISVIEGGTDELDNLRPEHRACNLSAGGRIGAARSRASIPGRPSNVVLKSEPTTDPKSQEWP